MEAQLLVLAKSIYYCNWRRRLYFFTVCDSIQTQQAQQQKWISLKLILMAL